MRMLQASAAEAVPLAPLSGSVVTIGNFDGVHIGHQALIRKAMEEAERQRLPLLIFTFTPHSGEALSGIEGGRIYTDRQKAALIEGIAPGADVIFFRFDRELAAMSEDRFFDGILLRRCHAKAVVVGENFRYGCGGKGNCATLTEHCRTNGLTFCPVSGVFDGGDWVSSTRIRRLLQEGNVREAGRLLGSPYQMEGEVLHGKRLGRKLGFPTVNLLLPEGLTSPRHGVYITRVHVRDKTYAGVTNVGVNPTVEHGMRVKAETHILNFEGDLYGEWIRLEFLRWKRDERRFDTVGELMEQLRSDIREAEGELTEAYR